MDYQSFCLLNEKPSGKTLGGAPIDGAFALDFANAGLALLADFSSFADLMGDIGIEESWSAEFPEIFPGYEPLACVDMDSCEELDSYTEFLLLVDTASPEAPVYWFGCNRAQIQEFVDLRG
jgi:hypothetical protein